MTETRVPAPIQAFIDATNAADTEVFVDTFTADAYLNDWGREFHGRDGVRSWNTTDNIGVRAHFDIVSVDAEPGSDTYVATLTVSGDGYNGTGPMRFELRDGRIARLTIS